jgi:GT2 family glycosyltransferase
MNNQSDNVIIGTETESFHSSLIPDENRYSTKHTVVSVVIVNFNGKKYLKDCIESLYAQTFQNLEIIVVDNASSDNSVDHLKSCYPDVVVIENPYNLGFAGGINTGIRKARGSFIFTLNNDTWVDCHCIERVVNAMTKNERIGMCATKMLFPDNRINSAGLCISRSGAAWDRGIFEEDNGQYDISEEVFGPCGGAALFRQKMFDDIGLFDEDFFLYGEDVDVALRGQLTGWKCIFVPTAVVYHYHCGTTGFMSDLATYYGNRNVLWYPVKDHHLLTLLISLPWILGRTLGIIPFETIRGKGKIILQSKIDGIAGIPKMWKKRKDVRRMVPASKINRFFKIWKTTKR